MNRQGFRTLTFVAAAVGLCLALIKFRAADARATQADIANQDPMPRKAYDWKASRNRLEAIGRVLLLYRKHRSITPIKKRRVIADLGVPLDPAVLLRVVPENLRFVDSSQPALEKSRREHLGSDYFFVYFQLSALFQPRELASLLRKRGDDLPILVDANMYSGLELAKSSTSKKVLVLRLSGRVTESYLNIHDYKEFFLNR